MTALTHASPPRTLPHAHDWPLCDEEHIHIPGAIQPHGALIAACATTLTVTHASANLMEVIGIPPRTALGCPLAAVIGPGAIAILLASGLTQAAPSRRLQVLTDPEADPIQMQAHRTGSLISIDIELRNPHAAGEPSTAKLQSTLASFSSATTQLELCAAAVRGLKTITGYDRVMAYRFEADGHGAVIAEAVEPHLEPYLGIHYPAGDIPPQARRLFIRQPVCTTANFGYVPVPLLAERAATPQPALDLTHSALRSVSPVHRKYMTNIRAAASLTIALMRGDDLWGMIICHHGTPRVAGPGMRITADMIGCVVSILLKSLGQTEKYSRRLGRVQALQELVDHLTNAKPLPMALKAAEASVLRLVDADGALVRIAGSFLRLGSLPPQAEAEQALAALWREAHGQVLGVNDLSLRDPSLAGCRAQGSGALLQPLSRDSDDAILWFRPEQARTVDWGGDPAKHVSVDTLTGELSPRESFAIWTEQVEGQSVPWSDSEVAIANDLRTALEVAIAQRTKAELAQLRFFDPLTALPNRRMLQEKLAKNSPAPPVGVLLFLDLDRFKTVNDTMGHQAGDELLIQVAARLLRIVRPTDMVARLGGDEFVVLSPGLNRAAAIALAERIRLSIEAPFTVAGRECHISISVGIAMTGELHGLDVVQAADMAMYAAKQNGGNRSEVFDCSLFERASGQFELDHDMREALAKGDQFTLQYQPLFHVASGVKRLVGFEALVRWRHPRKGWMSPGLFIPFAEKSGLIVPLGNWVLTAALRQWRAFQDACPGKDMQIAVNVSPLQLAQAAFLLDLAAALDAEGVSPGSLCLEVTESILTNVAATQVLTEARTLGVHVAIDDFGVGYSSLSYLCRLPVDVVKLDRSFLEVVEGDRRGNAFVAAVIALAHSVGKPVIFEGIETQAQFDIAVMSGADLVQGFLLARPLCATAAEAFVVRHLAGEKAIPKTPTVAAH